MGNNFRDFFLEFLDFFTQSFIRFAFLEKVRFLFLELFLSQFFEFFSLLLSLFQNFFF